MGLSVTLRFYRRLLPLPNWLVGQFHHSPCPPHATSCDFLYTPLFVFADTQLYKRLCPSICPLVRHALVVTLELKMRISAPDHPLLAVFPALLLYRSILSHTGGLYPHGQTKDFPVQKPVSRFFPPKYYGSIANRQIGWQRNQDFVHRQFGRPCEYEKKKHVRFTYLTFLTHA